MSGEDDRECSGEPRDLCESLELSIVQIGLETTELQGNNETQIATVCRGQVLPRPAGRVAASFKSRHAVVSAESSSARPRERERVATSLAGSIRKCPYTTTTPTMYEVADDDRRRAGRVPTGTTLRTWEDARLWRAGAVQGPYHRMQMRFWFEKGYFEMKTPVRNALARRRSSETAKDERSHPRTTASDPQTNAREREYWCATSVCCRTLQTRASRCARTGCERVLRSPGRRVPALGRRPAAALRLRLPRLGADRAARRQGAGREGVAQGQSGRDLEARTPARGLFRALPFSRTRLDGRGRKNRHWCAAKGGGRSAPNVRSRRRDGARARQRTRARQRAASGDQKRVFLSFVVDPPEAIAGRSTSRSRRRPRTRSRTRTSRAPGRSSTTAASAATPPPRSASASVQAAVYD